MAWRRGGLARLMVEGVSDEVGSLGEESNAEEGKRVPREREWNQYVEAQVCASPVPHACFGVGPGRPNTRVSTRRGWIKAAVSCLPSLPPSSSPYGSNPRGRTRVCARVYTRNSMVSNVIGISFLACLRGTSSLLKYREKLLSPAFSRFREGNELGNCRGSYCSLFVNFIHDFVTILHFLFYLFFVVSSLLVDVSFGECVRVEDDAILMIYIWEWECLAKKLIYGINVVLWVEYFQVIQIIFLKKKN